MHLNLARFTFSKPFEYVLFIATSTRIFRVICGLWAVRYWNVRWWYGRIQSVISNWTDYIATWISRSIREIVCFACHYHINFIDLFNAFAKKTKKNLQKIWKFNKTLHRHTAAQTHAHRSIHRERLNVKCRHSTYRTMKMADYEARSENWTKTKRRKAEREKKIS